MVARKLDREKAHPVGVAPTDVSPKERSRRRRREKTRKWCSLRAGWPGSDVAWRGVAWCGVIRFGLAGFGVVWCGVWGWIAMRCDVIRYDTILCKEQKIGQDNKRLDCMSSDWIGLDWAWLSWIGLAQIELDWIGWDGMLWWCVVWWCDVVWCWKFASCSVKPPTMVKIGTRSDPPPMPAADARTVAENVAAAVCKSVFRRPKSDSCSSLEKSGVERKREKHFSLQCRWLWQLGSHSSHVVEHSG